MTGSESTRAAALTALFHRELPPPARTACPQHFHHTMQVYKSAYTNKATKRAPEPDRFADNLGQCVPTKNAKPQAKALKCATKFHPPPSPATQTRVRRLYDEFNAEHPIRRAPKRKDERTLALDRLVAAFDLGFPKGGGGGLTAAQNKAIDDAINILNRFDDGASGASKTASSSKIARNVSASAVSKTASSSRVQATSSPSALSKAASSSKVGGKASSSSTAVPVRDLRKSCANTVNVGSSPAIARQSASSGQAVTPSKTGKEKATYDASPSMSATASASSSKTPTPSKKGKESDTKGKGKAHKESARLAFLADEAENIQADAYDPDLFDVVPSEGKSTSKLFVTIVVYAYSNEAPLIQRAHLRSKSNFDFRYFMVAKAVHIAPVDDSDTQPCPRFHRFSLSSLEFTPDGVLSTINLTNRGNIVLYREENLTDDECPGIDDWITRACEAAYAVDDSDNEASGAEDVDAEDESDPDVPSAHPSSPCAARKRKRSERDDGDEGISAFLDTEARLMAQEDEDDRRLRKFPSSGYGNVLVPSSDGDVEFTHETLHRN
ncbi:hypothetical protein R3P38DRAFT_3235308 [Favolaschia claudopus]|uniref:Uncharacterized protein n=1 Tax=Favolaschia claudopus TaxID=2862362 RepID=A0AAV9ZF06_9AGAR